ncbi:MAG: MoxR family ATPase [Oscillospiraceae bacterium]|nr:MoxR family ATPase [Oscillospiraceae bacterium]
MIMLDFLRQEGIDEQLIARIGQFRSEYPVAEGDALRIPSPRFKYYGADIWKLAITAILSGENILLVGPKATGKNVLAENLSAVFGRPQWDVSFYLNTDASTLIGTDTFKNGEVSFRKGPIYACAEAGGFGVLDEINMAKNESLAVLHATLDFRRIIDVPGYSRIRLAPPTRFIATMNYGYAGTRELNEALASRFMVINMPVISGADLEKLLLEQYPSLKAEYASQLTTLFGEIRKKCESSEISTKALDLRGLLAAVTLVQNGLSMHEALDIAIINKSFDEFERTLVDDIVSSRIDGKLRKDDIFAADDA